VKSIVQSTSVDVQRNLPSFEHALNMRSLVANDRRTAACGQWRKLSICRSAVRAALDYWRWPTL